MEIKKEKVQMKPPICLSYHLKIIQKITGHKGDIIWDATKPDGTPRKLMDVSKMKAIGWQYSTALEAGIQKTYTWFLENINNFKEVKL